MSDTTDEDIRSFFIQSPDYTSLAGWSDDPKLARWFDAWLVDHDRRIRADERAQIAAECRECR